MSKVVFIYEIYESTQIAQVHQLYSGIVFFPMTLVFGRVDQPDGNCLRPCREIYSHFQGSNTLKLNCIFTQSNTKEYHDYLIRFYRSK